MGPLGTRLLVSLCLCLLTCATETVYDAARIARNLVDGSLSSVGSMATVYPSDDPYFPALPFSFPEYYASCYMNGSLTILFLPISRHSRNILGSAGHSASLSVTTEKPVAAHARVALIGNVTIFKDNTEVPDLARIQQCYLLKHPDARGWLPDDDEGAHLSYWARFDPHTIYFVGGFGGEHYIGYIPVQLYQAAGPIQMTVDEDDNSIKQQQILQTLASGTKSGGDYL